MLPDGLGRSGYGQRLPMRVLCKDARALDARLEEKEFFAPPLAVEVISPNGRAGSVRQALEVGRIAGDGLFAKQISGRAPVIAG